MIRTKERIPDRKKYNRKSEKIKAEDKETEAHN